MKITASARKVVVTALQADCKVLGERVQCAFQSVFVACTAQAQEIITKKYDVEGYNARLQFLTGQIDALQAEKDRLERSFAGRVGNYGNSNERAYYYSRPLSDFSFAVDNYVVSGSLSAQAEEVRQDLFWKTPQGMLSRRIHELQVTIERNSALLPSYEALQAYSDRTRAAIKAIADELDALCRADADMRNPRKRKLKRIKVAKATVQEENENGET